MLMSDLLILMRSCLIELYIYTTYENKLRA